MSTGCALLQEVRSRQGPGAAVVSAQDHVASIGPLHSLPNGSEPRSRACAGLFPRDAAGTHLGPKSSQEAAVELERSVWEELVRAGGARRVWEGVFFGGRNGTGWGPGARSPCTAVTKKFKNVYFTLTFPAARKGCLLR